MRFRRFNFICEIMDQGRVEAPQCAHNQTTRQKLFCPGRDTFIEFIKFILRFLSPIQDLYAKYQALIATRQARYPRAKCSNYDMKN